MTRKRASFVGGKTRPEDGAPPGSDAEPDCIPFSGGLSIRSAQVLVFHIGLPKTATTFLQYRLFARTIRSGYFHWKSEKQVLDIMRLAHGEISERSLRCRRLAAWLRAACERDGPTLISCENISSGRASPFWEGQGPSPSDVARRLVDLATLAGIAQEDVRIILGVRRQDQMLASRFSQAATTFSGFSQQKFAEAVAAILSGGSAVPAFRWLYFDICKDEIEARLAAGNLFIHTAESVKAEPRQVVDRLGAFCGYDFLPALDEAMAAGALLTVNRKSIAPDRWRLVDHAEGLSLDGETKAAILAHFDGSNTRLLNATGLGF